MRKLILATVAVAALLATAGCGKKTGGVFARRGGPDEFAVAKAQPLVIPPDYALTPPRPGAPRPQEADSSSQALQAMFGGPAPASASEGAVISRAGGARAEPGIRSAAGDPGTTVVDKGSVTSAIIAAPEGGGADANASVPQ